LIDAKNVLIKILYYSHLCIAINNSLIKSLMLLRVEYLHLKG